jgi:hypothetical protein
MLLAREDMDDFGSRLRDGDEGLKMGHVHGGSAGGGQDYTRTCHTRLQLHPGTRV